MSLISKFLLFIIVLYAISLSVTPVFADVSLHVPFTPQAPFGNWSEPWFDACEETSITMVNAYYKTGSTTIKIPAKQAVADIRTIFTIKDHLFGRSLDENAKEVTAIINDALHWSAWIVENPTLSQIKKQLDAKHPVIIPTDLKMLHHIHYLYSGPAYHMIVLSGYDEATKQFIVEDPGRTNGHDYRYSYATVMNAMHNYVPNRKTFTGKKIAIFTTPNINLSATTDADKDGLTKIQEFVYGTIPWLADTDGDGFPDGLEVADGYSPLVAESKLPNLSLIKTSNSPKVYLFSNHTKQWIPNQKIFFENNWKWSDIIDVSRRFISQVPNGNPIF